MESLAPAIISFVVGLVAAMMSSGLSVYLHRLWGKNTDNYIELTKGTQKITIDLSGDESDSEITEKIKQIIAQKNGGDRE